MRKKARTSDVLLTVACLNLLLVSTVSQEFSKSLDASDKEADRVLSRQKRYLIFPQGSNIQLVYCLTIGAYGRNGDLVLGLTAAMAWELPSKLDNKFPDLLHRRTRSVAYPKIEAFLKSAGLDGRSCVLKALCEAGQRPNWKIGQGTFLQELMHAVFTLPKDGGKFESVDQQDYDLAYGSNENCTELYPACEHSVYDLAF
ncbi:uncharacterized protein LOC107274885 [Cephus cinctus]|uniref:Uncharacterized protein LOC107274885 n=1 Tax=Cephus cinctus TaxID=211228 RepID=A0AAJ7CFX6_CEPCN|nr:uncharacterized protein LOC107274885 [Cephus cinctus]